MTRISRRQANWLIATGAVAATGISSAAQAMIPHGHAMHPTKGLIQMTQNLGKLSHEHFESLIGETFTVGGHRTRLRAVRLGPKAGAKFRQQFALTFDTPEGTPIRSDVVPVSHPAIGDHTLLVTRVLDADTETALEICFS